MCKVVGGFCPLFKGHVTVFIPKVLIWAASDTM